MNNNVNILLVHGAWADGSCWNKVLLLLKAKGYSATAAQIPLTSLADDIAVTRRLLSGQPGPTVLVGHISGFTATNHDAFAADVTEDEAYLMAAVQKPLSLASFAGAETPPAWKTIPS